MTAIQHDILWAMREPERYLIERNGAAVVKSGTEIFEAASITVLCFLRDNDWIAGVQNSGEKFHITDKGRAALAKEIARRQKKADNFAEWKRRDEAKRHPPLLEEKP